MAGKKEEQSLGDRFKKGAKKDPVKMHPDQLKACGIEKRSAAYRENQPFARVPDWVMDNDFGGASTAPPNEDMDRLEKEIRTVIGELEQGQKGSENVALNNAFNEFFEQMCNVGLPQVLVEKIESSKAPPK